MWEGEVCLSDQFHESFFVLIIYLLLLLLLVSVCVSLCMCGVFENSFVELILPFTFTWVLGLKLR